MNAALLRIWRFLGSREFALALMVTWALLLVVWVIPFQFYGLPDTQIREIVYAEIFFKILYAVFAVATTVCLSVRSVKAVRVATRRPDPKTSPRRAPEPLHVDVPFDPELAQAALTAAGYRSTVSAESWVWGVKRPWSALGTIVLHAALLLVMLTLGLQRVPELGFEGSLLVTEGETYAGASEAFFDLRAPEQGAPPKLEFTPATVSPRFYENILLFTALESEVDTPGGRRYMSLSTPWFAAWDTMVTLQDFGYSVELVATPEDGGQVTKEIHSLKAFPSGQTDVIETQIDAESYRMYVSVYGDYVDRGGKPGVRSFNTDNPYLMVSVARVLDPTGERIVAADEVVKVGGSLEIPGATVEFPAIRHYGVYRVVKSPLFVMGIIAFALLSVGAAMRLVAPRAEALVVADEDGGVLVSTRMDVYRRSHASEAQIRDALGGSGGASHD